MRRRTRSIVLGGLVVLVLVLAAGLVWVWRDLRAVQGAAGDRAAAARAAGAHAVNMLSVSHETVDADVRRVLSTSTGAARQAYSAGAGELRSTILTDRVVQTGVLRSVGVVSMGTGTAKVLVVADGVISWEGRDTAPQERFYRWSMDLSEVGGAWLVAKAEQVL